MLKRKKVKICDFLNKYPLYYSLMNNFAINDKSNEHELDIRHFRTNGDLSMRRQEVQVHVKKKL